MGECVRDDREVTLPRGDTAHDAFISYSTVSTARVGAAVEYVLETLGRTLDEPRILDVFRDVSDQPATGDLAAAILAHLDVSRFLVLLASPAAAQSPWVRDEIRHWLDRHGVDNLLLVLAAGELQWDSETGHFDRVGSTALPTELSTAFSTQPKWVDLTDVDADPGTPRFVDAVADLSATITGTSKEALVGRHRTVQRQQVARRLAQHAGAIADTAVDLSLLLGAAAVDLDDCPETRSALVDVLERTGGEVTAVGQGASVGVIAHGLRPETVLIGREDGTVIVWDVNLARERGRYEPCPGVPVTAIAAAREAGVIAVGNADGSVTFLGDFAPSPLHLGGGRVTTLVIDDAATRLGAAMEGDDGQPTVYTWGARDGQVVPVEADVLAVRHLVLRTDELLIFERGELVSVELATMATRTVGQLPFLLRPGPTTFDVSGTVGAMAQFDGGAVTVFPVARDDDEREGPSDVSERVIDGPSGICHAVAFDSEAKLLATVVGNRMTVRSVDDDDVVLVQDGLPSDVTQVLVGDDAAWIAVRGADRCEVRVPGRSALVRRLPTATVEVPSAIQGAVSADFDPTGRWLAWVCNPSPTIRSHVTVATWDRQREAAGPQLATDSARTVRFLDGRVLEVSGLDGTVSTWDIEQRRQITSPAPPVNAPVRTVEIDYERSRAVVADAQRVMYTVAWEGPLRVLAKLDATGEWLAVARSDGRLDLHHVDAGAVAWTVPTPELEHLAFSPNEGNGGTSEPPSILATVTTLGRVTLLDVATGRIAGRVAVPSSPVHRLAFSADARVLAVASVGGAITVIDVDPASWVALARRRAGRQLRDGERAAFGVAELRLPPPSGSAIAGGGSM